MSGDTEMISIPLSGLDTLMPLHLVFDAAGQVIRSGPLLRRLSPPPNDQPLGDLLTVHRPTLPATAPSLLAAAGRRLVVDLTLAERWHEATGVRTQRLRAAVVPLADGSGLMHLNFGTDLSQAVIRYKLTAQDFSPISDVMETLYLLEAQSLIRGEMEALMVRLDRAREQAETEAVTDRLTGLGNRRAIDRAMRSLVARPGGEGFGIMQLDLDLFKQVNDTMGHAAGDAVLMEVANILREETRRGDHLCRMGGDEFVLLFPGCTDADILAGIAERILTRLRQPIPIDGKLGQISGSIGIAMSVDYPDPSIDQMLSDSDAALYRAKNMGRARYEFHRPHATAPDETGHVPPRDKTSGG